jgi:hypothetical protein
MAVIPPSAHKNASPSPSVKSNSRRAALAQVLHSDGQYREAESIIFMARVGRMKLFMFKRNLPRLLEEEKRKAEPALCPTALIFVQATSSLIA